MFAAVLQNKHKEIQIKLYNSSDKGFANFPVLSVTETSILVIKFSFANLLFSSSSSAMQPLCWYNGNQSY